MLKPLHILLSAIMMSTIVSACSPTKPTPTISPLPVPTNTQVSFSSPQPTPPYTKPGVAVVQGTLTLMDPTVAAPREDGLYFVRIEVDPEKGVALVVPAVDPDKAVQAKVDEVTGQFFAELPAGSYAMVAVTDSGLQLSVRKLDSGEAVVIMVKSQDLGKAMDLGALRLP